ncbi:hypothetical protein [Nostoc sphaeroides]|uniref:IS5 family transposase n=1 Tax=Nostoc sphaeroides CCNUC1 TaxID=2653204 RepID=A0A5P8WDU4_9NOSO|nr:IS5 family transposase [Nostoc sphaeroides CCNUC1]
MTDYGSGLGLLRSDRQAPSHAIVDSQSIKSAAMVSKAVGYDAGKKVKGRKDYGEAIGIKSYRQELFKHPLSAIHVYTKRSKL